MTNRFRVGFLATVSIAVLLSYVLYNLYSQRQHEWFLAKIPASLEVTDSLSIGSDGFFRESCGAAVFQLSNAAIQTLRNRGLDALVSARQARSHSDSYHSFSAWRATPHVITGDGMTLADRWPARVKIVVA